MQMWGCEASLMVAQASTDNENQMGCPFRSNALGTDSDKGVEMCTTVRSKIGELH